MATKKDAAADDRGTVAVSLDGQDYRLRPSYGALVEIEAQLRPILDLCQDAAACRLTLRELGVIIAEMMHAEGAAMADDAPGASGYRGAKPDRISQMVLEAGIPQATARVAIVLAAAVTGGVTAAGEAKARTKTTAATSSSAPA